MTSGSFDQGTISFGSPNYQLEIVRAEHDSTGNVSLKKTGLYAWDAKNMVWRRVAADASGQLTTSDNFAIPAYDSLNLNWTGNTLTSVDYFSGGLGGTLVATLTLTYDGMNKLQSVEVI
jgi:hypothetical protein